MRRSVVRLPDGAIMLRLSENERSIIRALVGDLRTIIGDQTPTPGVWEAGADDEAGAGDEADGPATAAPVAADPVLARLYPDVRPEDPAWSASFRDLVRGDLDDARRENLAVVEESIEARTVDDGQAEAWLHVLNDVRLVLGTRLEVSEEDEQAGLDPEDPDAAAKVVYAYAGYLEAQFVDVLGEALPDVPDDAPTTPDPEDDGEPDED
jgi:hypothetical protein